MSCVDETILVERGDKKPWVFQRTADGKYLHRGKKWLYRLIWERDPGHAKPCWIGREALPNTGVWCTAERDIGATAVVFSFGRYVFSDGYED